MTMSILIEKHTEMKQKQMKCSVFYSFAEACQIQIVKFLYNDCCELTKKKRVVYKNILRLPQRKRRQPF